MNTNPYQKTSWIKKYLLYGAIGVSMYVAGKYIASRIPSQEIQQQTMQEDKRINQLESIVHQLEQQEKDAVQENNKLKKENNKLKNKIAKYQ